MYRTIEDLPRAEVARYDEFQRQVFLDTFNRAYETYHHDEAIALARAHAAAQDARKKPEEFRKGSMSKNRLTLRH